MSLIKEIEKADLKRISFLRNINKKKEYDAASEEYSELLQIEFSEFLQELKKIGVIGYDKKGHYPYEVETLNDPVIGVFKKGLSKNYYKGENLGYIIMFFKRPIFKRSGVGTKELIQLYKKTDKTDESINTYNIVANAIAWTSDKTFIETIKDLIMDVSNGNSSGWLVEMFYYNKIKDSKFIVNLIRNEKRHFVVYFAIRVAGKLKIVEALKLIEFHYNNPMTEGIIEESKKAIARLNKAKS